MTLVKRNENGNYEYSEEEYAQLQEYVYTINTLLYIMRGYCEHHSSIKQISPLLLLCKVMKTNLRNIYCRF